MANYISNLLSLHQHLVTQIVHLKKATFPMFYVSVSAIITRYFMIDYRWCYQSDLLSTTIYSRQVEPINQKNLVFCMMRFRIPEYQKHVFIESAVPAINLTSKCLQDT
jgi:hypothetical protein